MKFLSYAFILLAFTACGISEEVKRASDVQTSSQQLFAKENLKFYATVDEALSTCIEAEIGALEAARTSSIATVREGIDDENAKTKADASLSTEDKALKFLENERILNQETAKINRKIDAQIATQNARREKLKESIRILTEMQHSLTNSSEKLNEYVKVKRASEDLLDIVKSTFPSLEGKISEYESLLEGI